MRSRIFEVFEDADRDPSVIAKGALNIVVVGGGPTGVETAGALADLIREVMPSRYHDLDVRAARVTLVDPGQSCCRRSPTAPTLRGQGPPAKGVDLELGLKVSDIAADRVTLSDGRQIMTRTVVWAGGIQASSAIGQAGIAVGHGGRIDVQPDLDGGRVRRHLRPRRRRQHARLGRPPLPQLGSVALQAGRCAADNILRRHRRPAPVRRSATATRGSWR